jgi:predicted secreted protein
MAGILLDERWNGKRIEIKVGDEIRIELQGVGATGYAWHFDKFDPDFFEIKHQEIKKSAHRSGETVGSPVRHTWIILLRRAGSSTIEMSYYRIWEGKDKSIRRFKIDVDVIP